MVLAKVSGKSSNTTPNLENTKGKRGSQKKEKKKKKKKKSLKLKIIKDKVLARVWRNSSSQTLITGCRIV